MKSRIDYLDGLRGLAILLVLGFHAYTRWPEIVPYGGKYADFPLFRAGWLGVQLFFLISGFVILMTLDKSISSSQFIYKRWLRLFPSMLIATCLIYLTSSFFNERPEGQPELISLLPGLTFIEPSWWGALTGIDIKPLEGAFWSLYVEFKFYVIAAIIYFSLGRRFLVPILLFLYVNSIALTFMATYIDSGAIKFLYNISNELSLHEFGWFAAGSAFYIFHQTKDKKWFGLGCLAAIICSIFVRNLAISPIIPSIFVSVFFALSLISVQIQKLLTNKILLFFGFISYPLYLIHQNAMISSIVKIHTLLPWLLDFLYPILPILALAGASYLIAKKYESKVRSLIRLFPEPK